MVICIAILIEVTMMKKRLITALVISISGCSLLSDNTGTPADDNQYQNMSLQGYTLAQPIDNGDLTVNHYAKQMMLKMTENLKMINSETPVAVSSFIYVDDYDNSDLLGNQLTESFLHELHLFGVPVVDFKTTSYMRVAETGDFVLSRDFMELDQGQSFDYVLTGTMTNQHNGVLVNARIVGMKSKAVVGTTQGFIPRDVIKTLKSSKKQSSLMIR